eukprot:gene42952-43398_t
MASRHAQDGGAGARRPVWEGTYAGSVRTVLSRARPCALDVDDLSRELRRHGVRDELGAALHAEGVDGTAFGELDDDTLRDTFGVA